MQITSDLKKEMHQIQAKEFPKVTNVCQNFQFNFMQQTFVCKNFWGEKHVVHIFCFVIHRTGQARKKFTLMFFKGQSSQQTK